MTNGQGLSLIIALAAIVELTLAIAITYARDRRQDFHHALRVPVGLLAVIALFVQHKYSLFAGFFFIDRRRRAKLPPHQRLQAYREQLAAQPKQLFIFVRGTFGAGGYDQRWGGIVAQIRKREPASSFYCFYWPGQNSEQARRRQGAILALAVRHLTQNFPGIPIIAIGHSHGGSVITHASRYLPAECNFSGILIATPELHFGPKLADFAHARVTAMMYASALIFLFLLSVLVSWVFAAFGQTWFFYWGNQWLLSIGLALGCIVFALRTKVRRAREAVLQELPPIKHRIFRIWGEGDETFSTFAKTDHIRHVSQHIFEVVNQRLDTLRAAPYFRWAIYEFLVCAICWYVLAKSVEIMVQTGSPALLPGYAEPGMLRDLMTVLAALMCKLLIYGRPGIYRLFGDMASLVLLTINLGLAQWYRVSLAGLSIFEGVLVEIFFSAPKHDGRQNFALAVDCKPNFIMRLHSQTLGAENIQCKVADVIVAIG